MASFDFQVAVQAWEKPFAMVLLKDLRRLARHRLCERRTIVRFRWFQRERLHEYKHYTVTVEGDFAEVHSFAFDAMISLQHFARGFQVAYPVYRKSLLSTVLPIAFIKKVSEVSDDMHALERFTERLGEKLRLNSYLFRKTGNSDVDRVLKETTGVLLQWRSHRLTGPTLVEQIHTACEVSLKAILGAVGPSVIFRSLVTDAESRGIIDAAQGKSLLDLKDTRRNSKHLGHGIKPQRLSVIVRTSVEALHSLVSACAKMNQPGS